MNQTTVKIASFRSTREIERQLKELCDRLGENKSAVITRSIQQLYQVTFNEKISLKENSNNTS